MNPDAVIAFALIASLPTAARRAPDPDAAG
jgi:hypothetical protein